MWVVVVFGLTQILRLGSNLVLTRLLEPEMFGVMAIVNVMLIGVVMFSDVGLWPSIVRNEKGTEKYFVDTVWTMQVIRGILIFLVLLVSIGLFVYAKDLLGFELQGVYGDPLLPTILLILSFVTLIKGFDGMASAIASKELKRGRLELIELLSQLAGVTVMLIWAWYSPTIWALVSSGLVSVIVGTALTYTLFQYRHSFTWDKAVVKEVLNFGKWIFLSSALTFLCVQGDKILLAHYLTAAELGVYSIAFFLANSLESLVIQIGVKIWFPYFSKVKEGYRDGFKQLYYKIRLKQDILVFFITGVLMATGSHIIDVLYDDRYQKAGEMLQILAFSIAGSSILAVGLECLASLGISKTRMGVMLVRCVGVFVGLPLLFINYGLYGVTWGVAFNAWVGIPILYHALYKEKLFSFWREIRMLPMIAVGFFMGKYVAIFIISIDFIPLGDDILYYLDPLLRYIPVVI